MSATSSTKPVEKIAPYKCYYCLKKKFVYTTTNIVNFQRHLTMKHRRTLRQHEDYTLEYVPLFINDPATDLVTIRNFAKLSDSEALHVLANPNLRIMEKLLDRSRTLFWDVDLHDDDDDEFDTLFEKGKLIIDN